MAGSPVDFDRPVSRLRRDSVKIGDGLLVAAETAQHDTAIEAGVSVILERQRGINVAERAVILLEMHPIGDAIQIALWVLGELPDRIVGDA